MSKLKRTSAKGAFFALAVWLTGLCMSAPAYSAVCFLPDDTGNCGTGDMKIVPDEPKKGVCDGKTTYTPEEYNEKFDDNCYTYTVGEKNGKTVYCDITKTETKGYVLDAQDHCCQSGTAWDNKAQECCTGGKCPITCPDPDLYIIKNDLCVCKNGSDIHEHCCPLNTIASSGICCPYDQEGKADGSSLICCPKDQVNKGGECVDPVPVWTCSDKSEYKQPCPTGYTPKEAKDVNGNLVKDSNGTQCYTCKKQDGKNPITVRLRLTCDGQACPDAIYDGDYTFYYANYKESQVGTRDTNNDIVITIPDWKIDDFLVKTDDENTNYYNVKVSVKGTFAATNYQRKDSSGGYADVYTSPLDTSISNLEGNNDKSFGKDESGEKELIIPEDLTKGSNPNLNVYYYVYAKVKCPGPYKEIRACEAANRDKWGYSETDDICPYRVTSTSTSFIPDYFSGANYSTGYAKDASQCASYTLVVNGKDSHRLSAEKIDKTDQSAGIIMGNIGFMDNLGIDNFKEIDFSKLKDDEELVKFAIQLPTGSSYARAKYSLKVTPMNTGHVIAQPDMGNWGDKSGKEYAFVGDNGKISVGESQTIPLKLDNKALYTYVSGIKTMHPVIRLRSVVETISPKELKSGGSTYSMPYAYKSFRRLPSPSNGGVDLAQVSYEHWVHYNQQVCSTKALNVYVAASRNVLSPIKMNLQDNGINADVVMQKGDIIAYPIDNPWCRKVSGTLCDQKCGCNSKDGYMACKDCVDKCEEGNQDNVSQFLVKNTTSTGVENEYNTKNRRQVNEGPSRSGYVHSDGAIYIFESGFNISENGTTGTDSAGSDYETCYQKTCEDFGLSSNYQDGKICKNAYSGCNNLTCYKCAYRSCWSESDGKPWCEDDIYQQVYDENRTFCTWPQSDTEGINTTCARLAQDSEVQNYLNTSLVVSEQSKFVDYFINPDDATSTDTRRCAVCVYDKY